MHTNIQTAINLHRLTYTHKYGLALLDTFLCPSPAIQLQSEAMWDSLDQTPTLPVKPTMTTSFCVSMTFIVVLVVSCVELVDW